MILKTAVKTTSFLRSLLAGILLLVLLNSSSTAQVNAPVNNFAVKGFHLDLRIQVMKMQALKDFALQLSKNGINTLVMEWEASYPYEKHRVITGRYSYSREDIKDFVAYCNSINIDVVPLQQSFGHVEYILKHYRYRDLREDQKDFSQVNPLKEELCKALFTDLFADMASTHTSQYIHIGGDETYLLGLSAESKKKVEAVGKGRLYGDYIKILCEIVVGLGKRPVVWADIALKYPDALVGLPKETIFVDWNYGWALNRFGDHEKLMKAGFEIWGSPAIRSSPDNYFLTDWKKHFDNMEVFIPEAARLGYKGMVMTSWSTSGIYNNIYESHSDVWDLHAIRRVYPITGFNMIISGYFEQLKSGKTFVTTDFVREYTKTAYGFNDQQSTLFWNALKRAPFEVNQGKVSRGSIKIIDLLDSAKQSAAELRSLKPTGNKSEFDHYLLMSDIRVFYLNCVMVENEMNLASFTFDRAPELLRILNALNPEDLNKRFTRLNKNSLFAEEIKLENKLRNERLEALKLRLLGKTKG